MSIFPKRTIQGKAVTIHWSVALESELNSPLFPFVRLGVKSPDGQIVYLCQKHILLLPKAYHANVEHEETRNETSEKQNLARNIPIMILADYLSGKRKREQLVEILTRIKTARHFYFSYPVAEDAPLGRYELVSELYLDGECHKSLTADEDFFYVEKVIVQRTGEDTYNVNNPSSEDCPIKVIDYTANGSQTTLYSIPAMANLTVQTKSTACYLLYNEERETVALKNGDGKKILRNQTLQNFEKKEGISLKVYVMFPDSDDAYILEGNYLKIWQLADGTVEDNELRSVDEKAYTSMLKANLLYEF